jgi:hypothetical protein
LELLVAVCVLTALCLLMLCKQVWQLTLTPTGNQELKQAGFDAQQEQAFICNLQVRFIYTSLG